eukprot:2475016-Alexandrium_andersonii.AAC.1
MCIRDRVATVAALATTAPPAVGNNGVDSPAGTEAHANSTCERSAPVSYTHLRAHETSAHL